MAYNALVRTDHTMTDTPTTCGAKTRDGSPCSAPPMQGKRRCRMHGGLTTGPKSPEAKARSAMNGLKHGVYMNTMAKCYEKMGVPTDVFNAMPQTTDLSPELRLARVNVVKYAQMLAEGKTHITIGAASLSIDVLYNQALLAVRAMAKTQQEIKPGGDIGGHLTFNINVTDGAREADTDDVPNLTEDSAQSEDIPDAHPQPTGSPKRGNGYDEDE